MTSNYPTSCLEVRRKQKVNKPIFKGCLRKKTPVSTSNLIASYSLVAHVCRKTMVFQTAMLLLSDMPFIKMKLAQRSTCIARCHCFPSPNGRIVTFKPWSCLQYCVHKNNRHDKKVQRKPVCKLWVFSKNQGVRRDSSEVIMTRHHA